MSYTNDFILVLPPSASSIRVARHAVRDWVRLVGADSIAEAAGLLVSELATNAVIHVGEPYQLAAHWRSPCFRVEVVDVAAAWPAVPVGQRDGPGGRGLNIVEQLSDAWGVDEHRYRKAVWFELQAREQ